MCDELGDDMGDGCQDYELGGDWHGDDVGVDTGNELGNDGRSDDTSDDCKSTLDRYNDSEGSVDLGGDRRMNEDSDDATSGRTVPDDDSSDGDCPSNELPTGKQANPESTSLDSVYTLIYFDFETTQDTPIVGADGQYEHVVNFAAARRVCNSCCKSMTDGKNCTSCTRAKWGGEDALRQFTGWLLQHDGSTALSHNYSGFDSLLLLRQLIKMGIRVRKLLQRGHKIMTSTIATGRHGVRLLDSMNFVMGPLSAFNKIFELKDTVKSFFPHRLNTSLNSDYRGPMPDKAMYDPDSMGAQRRSAFFMWYEQHRGDTFDMKVELDAYCCSDVDLLCEGMTKFRKIIFDLTGVDALRECITTAATAMRVFRRNYLQPDTIGIIPRKGYTARQRQSRIGALWLKWWSHKNSKRVLHNFNGSEYKIGKYFVDGYVKETNTVLEFLGCHFHSCPKCYKPSEVNKCTGRMRKFEHEETMQRLDWIRRQGYSVVTMRECKFHNLVKEDASLQAFMNEQQLSEPLRPVDALFGGRVNAIRMYYECVEGEQIRVLDFTSLYPYVNARCPYPLGHPKIYTEGFERIPGGEIFGLVKCRVLPPRNLYLPVLPYRSNGKLTFSLCRTCADDMNQEPCSHPDDDRAWEGTFVSHELDKAVEKGYIITHTYEVWHWDSVSEYDWDSKTGGLFTMYMSMFLKVKQESSGWPAGCDTDEAREAYLLSYLINDGIKLDPKKIAKSPLRAVAKLLLNALWGKFAQNPNLGKTEIVATYEELIKLLFDESVEVNNLVFLSEYMVLVQYKDRVCARLPAENVVIAAFTTAHARLRLYETMDGICQHGQDRLLYTDTDSVFYVQRPGVPDPSCGPFLGDLVDEYPDKRIVKFCSGGPKNYAYTFADGTSVTKVKGFTLNYRNALTITPALIQDMVKNPDGRSVEIFNERKITRSRQHGIISRPERRRYRIVYTKRVMSLGGLTFPYGHLKAGQTSANPTRASAPASHVVVQRKSPRPIESPTIIARNSSSNDSSTVMQRKRLRPKRPPTTIASSSSSSNNSSSSSSTVVQRKRLRPKRPPTTIASSSSNSSTVVQRKRWRPKRPPTTIASSSSSSNTVMQRKRLIPKRPPTTIASSSSSSEEDQNTSKSGRRDSLPKRSALRDESLPVCTGTRTNKSRCREIGTSVGFDNDTDSETEEEDGSYESSFIDDDDVHSPGTSYPNPYL